MKFKRTTLLTAGFIFFLAGLGFARTGWLISAQLLISLGISCLITFVRLRWLAMIAAVMFAFSLGWWRGQGFMLEAVQLDKLAGKKATAIVKARSDGVYNQRGQLSFEASDIKLVSPYKAELPGKLEASGFGEPAIFNGDYVKLSGRFYKKRGSKQIGISFAQMEVISRNSSFVDNIRRRFTAGLASAVPEPQASFGMGLLIGQRNTLPDYVTEQLSVVGLTHIIAVSGYNLTIIVRGVRRLLNKRSKYQSAVISMSLIGIFLLMTGMSASIVRAAIISGLSILAWYYGRVFRPLLLLVLTAAVTAAWNPFYLWSDIGWYLSFLAFFGVLIVAPLLHKRFFGGREPGALTGLMVESLTAFIMTAPLIMYIFKNISLIALPANLLIVPMVPFAMLFSVAAGLAAMFLPAFAGVFTWPATWIMTAMLDIVAMLARIPNILLERGVNLKGMLTMYASTILMTVIMWKKTAAADKLTDVK